MIKYFCYNSDINQNVKNDSHSLHANSKLVIRAKLLVSQPIPVRRFLNYFALQIISHCKRILRSKMELLRRKGTSA